VDPFLEAWKNAFTIQGRARRQEYWMFVLGAVIAIIVLAIIDNAIIGFPALTVLFELALIVPSFTAAIRRLHDTNHSGWALLLQLIPVVGGIILLVFLVQDGTPGPNRFGMDPKASPALG